MSQFFQQISIYQGHLKQDLQSLTGTMKNEQQNQLFLSKARPFSANLFFSFGSLGIIKGKAPSITLRSREIHFRLMKNTISLNYILLLTLNSDIHCSTNDKYNQSSPKLAVANAAITISVNGGNHLPYFLIRHLEMYHEIFW